MYLCSVTKAVLNWNGRYIFQRFCVMLTKVFSLKMFDDKAQNGTAVDYRIQQFSKNVNLLYPLLRNRHVPKGVKVLMYKTILRPTLCYGSESWTLTQKTRSKVAAAEMRVLRLIEGVTRRDRLRNVDIRERLELRQLQQL